MASWPPGTIILFGSLVLTLSRGRWLKTLSLALPILSFVHLLGWHQAGHVVTAQLFDYELTPVRVDKLSLVWGYVFHISPRYWPRFMVCISAVACTTFVPQPIWVRRSELFLPVIC